MCICVYVMYIYICVYVYMCMYRYVFSVLCCVKLCIINENLNEY